MKPFPWFLKNQKKILHLSKNHSSFSVECENLSFAPFVLSLFPHKKIFVLNASCFNEALDFFDLYDEGFAALPQPQNRPSVQGFVDFDKQILNISKNKCVYAWNRVRVCLVDEKMLNKPLFPNKTNKTHQIKAGDVVSRESLISQLKDCKYSRVESLNAPGQYVIRGGVVDVFSYSSMSPARVSFLDEKGVILFSINSEDGFLGKKVPLLCVSPGNIKKEKRIKDNLSHEDFLVYYKNKTLFFKKNAGLQHKKIILYKNTFDYLFYKKNSTKKYFYSELLQKKGLVVSNTTLIAPLWYKKSPKKTKNPLLISKMRVGDIYVHEKFGFCRYVGVDSSVENNEKVCLSFADGSIKVDVGRLDLLYYCKNNSTLLSSLSKKGVWAQTKKRNFLAAQEFVEGLFFLYKKRDKIKRRPCLFDIEINQLFIEGFKHKETEDQTSATEDVYKDLLSLQPMTRLLCGDVGFGKTEVALRAVFLCAANNKNSIVVSPTRILSNQLYFEFHKRLCSFGVSVFSSVDLFIKDNKKGSVLISTHKALNNNLALSLCDFMVVDEEHRFGVDQKERALKTNPLCDILYMSATPLPRTLQLSLSKTRNTSLLKTPPLSKKQIITRVYYFNKKLVKSVIQNEISRSGQVFFVDKSVNSVLFSYRLISSLFPLLSCAFLHGSLDFSVVKQTMSDFRSKKIDVLVSTTIIESGIDVGNANTIIINNADFFGLSQLYQMRGRVGRSSVQAHAFLLISKKQTPAAVSRLKSLVKHQSLGSGYNIAYDDLKIRGAGSLFGYKQSGGSGVGFEFYSKLVSDSLSFINCGFLNNPPSVVLGEGSIPFSSIPSSVDRVQIYKAVSECVSVDVLLGYFGRFSGLMGRVPFSFYCLIKNKQIEILLKETCFVSVVFSNGFLLMLLDKNSHYYSSGVFLSVVSFFKDKKTQTTVKTEGNNIKIQFKKSLKDCYILLVNLLEVLND